MNITKQLVNIGKSVVSRNSIALAILIGGFMPSLSAQEITDNRERVTFGIKAGINNSNVWDESGQDFRADNKVGLAGGVSLGLPLGKYIGIQPELLISQKGFQGSGTLLGNNYSLTRTTTYLDVPVQIQFKPFPFLTLLAGPQLSYLFKEKNVYTLGANSTEQENEFKNDNIRKNILGFTAGADVNIKKFLISGKAGWDFQTNHGDGSSSTPRYKNQWLQLTIGLLL